MKLPEVLSVFVVAGGDDFLVHARCPAWTACSPSSWTSSAGAVRSSPSAAQ
ncbi:MAG TPA: hypothetical protein VF657_09155 [Actinoplanes sp.]